jgi:hypothetical protein
MTVRSRKKNHFTVACWSNLQFVVALLPPAWPRSDDDSPWIKCSRLFLDRIAVASPQWENGLSHCLCECEIWSLTQGKNMKWGVREQGAEGNIWTWGRGIKLHDEDLHYLYSSSYTITAIKSIGISWAGHEARMGKVRNAYKILIGKLERKIPLWKIMRRWDDNITVNVKGIWCKGMDWIQLVQDSVQWTR